MGKTYKPISFFSDEIQIKPHTASDAGHIGRWVSIREFAQNNPVSLYHCDETGDFLAETGRRGIDYRFIEG